jgi:hypothetical protein
MKDLLNEGKKRGIKLTIIDSADYEDYKRVCDTICHLGFTAEIIDNGNTVFTNRSENDK